MKFEDAKEWIKEINNKNFAGFNDWRLPTIEEAMSLMESWKKKNLYINPIFDSRQEWIWTSDQIKSESRAWVVNFRSGYCHWYSFNNRGCVRAVRSM